MKALTWQGRSSVRIDDVPDPRIERPTDAVIRVTSTAICGSDLHLYEPLGPFLSKGDILGHETMGIVEEVGSEVTHISVGDRVVVPFNISCGHCWMCQRGFMAQCETTQVREQGMGASLFGFTELYGSVPGGQAEYLRVPQAQFGPILVPEGVADERFLYLSDILPTAWQGVEYADVPDGGSLAVIGLGPVGLMAAMSANIKGASQVFVVDTHKDRLALAIILDGAREGLARSGSRAKGVRDVQALLTASAVREGVEGARRRVLSTRRREDRGRAASNALGLLRERDAARAEVERLRAGIEALHRPVHPVFSWKTGLRFEEPCPECHGKAGVHSCGCWADEDTTYECAECAMPKDEGSRRVIPWPCPTVTAIRRHLGDDL